MKPVVSIPILCISFVVLWSSGFIGAKYGLGYSGTFTILFLRYLIVVAVLAVLVTATKCWMRLPLRELVRHSTVGALAHAVWLISVLMSIDLGLSAGLAAFITTLQPILTGMLSAHMTGERVGRREWLGLGLGLIAVALVIGDGISLGGAFIPYILPFVAVLAITIASLIDRNANIGEGTSTPVLFVTFIHCLASLIILFPCAWIFEGFAAEWNSDLIFAVTWLGLVVSLGAYGLMFILLRHISAPRVASLIYLTPPVTIIMAWFIFGETLTYTAIFGLGVAGIAVLLVSMPSSSPNIERPS